MPTYRYKCTECGKEEIIKHPISHIDEGVIYTCKNCMAQMVRQIGAIPTHFKCGGFHKTDYYKDKPSARNR